jgi:hypothetical protein
MSHRILSFFACIVLVVWGSPAVAVDYYKMSGNLAVYFGVMPSELMGHSPDHPAKITHGGVSASTHQRHVVVAVFDTKTGARIADADVTATVGESGVTPITKTLESMSIAGKVSYGNFFQMSSPHKYRFTIKVRLNGAQGRTVNFEFQHPR